LTPLFLLFMVGGYIWRGRFFWRGSAGRFAVFLCITMFLIPIISRPCAGFCAGLVSLVPPVRNAFLRIPQ